jgi:hypothetical protein
VQYAVASLRVVRVPSQPVANLAENNIENDRGLVRLMVYAAAANADLLWEENTTEWLADLVNGLTHRCGQLNTC